MSRTRTLRSMLFRIVSVISIGTLLIVAAMTMLSVVLLEQSISARQQASTIALARYGDQFLNDMEQLVRVAGVTALNVPPQQRARLLTQITINTPGINALYLLDPNGSVLADAAQNGALLGFDFSREPAFARALHERQTIISSPFLSPTSGEVAATIAVPFFREQQPYGVLLGELSLHELQAAISSVSVSKGELVMIVDHRGTVLAHPEPTWVQERRNLGNLSLFQDGLAGRHEPRIFYDPQQAQLMIGSASLMRAGWLVLTEQPLLVAMRPLLWMLAGVGTALALSIVLSSMAQRWGLHQISEPIAHLAATADDLASGRPHLLPAAPPTQLAELASLNASFTHMARQLQTTITALEQRISDVQRAEASQKEAVARLHSSLAEKETLLKEIHHRVKNNLQVVISLLRLQGHRLSDAQAGAALRESQQRIMTMALVHELLYRAGDLAYIDAGAYLRELSDQLLRVYGTDTRRIRVTVAVSQVALSLDHAVPCGLIVNELLSNSLKYAFPNGASGQVGVSLDALEPGRCCLTVWDNGVGLPDDVEYTSGNSLGMRLVQNLTRQLRGDLVIDRYGGTLIAISFATHTGARQVLAASE
jgi:two-component sensor histidine kinase/HAMP domain-containing protein